MILRLLALIALVVSPAAWAAKDCGAEAQAFTQAYKSYNDCSAAGRGAACAGTTHAYDSARTRLDACRQQARDQSRPSWESSSRDDRDDRDDERRTRSRDRYKRPTYR